jgi:hypothetical protein
MALSVSDQNGNAIRSLNAQGSTGNRRHGAISIYRLTGSNGVPEVVNDVGMKLLHL